MSVNESCRMHTAHKQATRKAANTESCTHGKLHARKATCTEALAHEKLPTCSKVFWMLSMSFMYVAGLLTLKVPVTNKASTALLKASCFLHFLYLLYMRRISARSCSACTSYWLPASNIQPGHPPICGSRNDQTKSAHTHACSIGSANARVPPRRAPAAPPPRVPPRPACLPACAGGVCSARVCLQGLCVLLYVVALGKFCWGNLYRAKILYGLTGRSGRELIFFSEGKFCWGMGKVFACHVFSGVVKNSS